MITRSQIQSKIPEWIQLRLMIKYWCPLPLAPIFSQYLFTGSKVLWDLCKHCNILVTWFGNLAVGSGARLSEESGNASLVKWWLLRLCGRRFWNLVELRRFGHTLPCRDLGHFVDGRLYRQEQVSALSFYLIEYQQPYFSNPSLVSLACRCRALFYEIVWGLTYPTQDDRRFHCL